jgi:D-alanyl-D-alanine carboxypeptidase/D-alanyl-D-alanine-endopeptidase (penicillin-binding protein 4)
MNTTRPLVASLLLAGIAFACNLSAADSSLSARIGEIINAPEYKHAHWGILAVDLESGAVRFEHQADKLFAPASVTKLYSVAAALDELGAQHRFETPVFRRGLVDKDGTLRGDFVLVASGDLALGGRTDGSGSIAFKDNDHTYANGGIAGELTAPDPLAGLIELARQVAASGIKRVRGDVLVDDRLFDKAESTGSGPSRLTPIMINDNLVDVLITPAKSGAPAIIITRPVSSALVVDGVVETAATNAPLRITLTAPAPGRLVVRGQIPEGHKPLLRVHEVDDASTWARALFIEALRRAGVAVDASPLAQNRHESLPARGSYKSEEQVAKLVSPPFAENVKLILKVSHNLHASTLPLLVAAKHDRRTLAQGMRLQHDFLARSGVDVETISFGGGAGGARSDCVTPRATAQLLRAMAKRPDFAVYEAALPVLGVDGTLATHADPASPARGKVKAKTGTFSWENTMNARLLLNSKALAGYIETAKGGRLAFAVFVNNAHFDRPTETQRIGKTLGKVAEILQQEF